MTFGKSREIRVFDLAHMSEIDVQSMTFSGGEVQVRALVTRSHADYLICADLRDTHGVMELLLVTDALRRQGVKRLILEMRYLPYARQDRVCASGEALSLKVFADLINAQRYDKVTVWDCHSDVGTALINNLDHIDQSCLALPTALALEGCVLVAPDSGALKKVMSLAKKSFRDFVRADKTRNPSTGAIDGTVVYSEHVGDRNFLIVDDICDGGRTFIELAKALRPLTSGEIYLYVTHGIFSAGLNVFDGVIDRVYVANPFVDCSSKPNFILTHPAYGAHK